MKQVQNGFADYYYLQKDGRLYNKKLNKYIKRHKNSYRMITSKGVSKEISLKKLYKLVYNNDYCEDDIKNLDNEVWKKIEGTKNYYISTYGRIKSYYGIKARLLKPFINNTGYERVDIITENGQRRTKLIHRLVAAAFLPMPKNLDYQLHHKNFDNLCNKLSNLEWLSPDEHRRKHRERSEKNVCS